MREPEPKNPDGASAAFKLSTLETIGADPLMRPIDHALLGAYMKYMKWPKRTAFLTNISARIHTSMSSEPTISASRARLVERGYLRPVVTKFNGAVIFEINNPRAEIIKDHIMIAKETLRERDAARKEAERQRRAKAKISLVSTGGEGQRNFRDSTKISLGNSLKHPLEEEAPKREAAQTRSFNAYARASRGAE